MAIQSDEIGAIHILKAAKKWRAEPDYGGFRDSNRYDVVIDGEHYPPKAIVGIAHEMAGKGILRPSQFAGALDGKWHQMLKGLGFQIVPKGLVRSDVADTGPSAVIDEDIKSIAAAHPDNATVRERLVLARLGQGEYRKRLLELWGGACAVTGCRVTQVIRASHAKPWRCSSDEERLNPDNGLPLVANLDALFDAGLIAFEGDGSMHVSSRLRNGAGLLDGIERRLLRPPTKGQASYLDHHLRNVFE